MNAGRMPCTSAASILVTHDIGNMVGHALAAQHPDRIKTWVAMERAVAGDRPLGGAAQATPKPGTSTSTGPDEERLVAGRERIYLDRFGTSFPPIPPASTANRRGRHYAALYARPHAIHDAMAQFIAFPRDGDDNKAFLAKGKLTTCPSSCGSSSLWAWMMK